MTIDKLITKTLKKSAQEQCTDEVKQILWTRIVKKLDIPNTENLQCKVSGNKFP